MRIFIDSDTSDCPGAVCKVVSERGRSLLVQSDWDAPGVASVFGWDCRSVQTRNDKSCYHLQTDGTIDCPDCGATASQFIESAMEWIADNDGAETDDPGYFHYPPPIVVDTWQAK